jgi:DUF917 family protein
MRVVRQEPIPNARTLDVDDLPRLARGCAVLAAGGGGDPVTAVLLAAEAIRECGPVPLVAPEDLPADGLVMPCGLVGSPIVAVEKLSSGQEGVRAAEVVEELLGRPVVAVMAAQIGGSNGVLPVTWAARLGVPYLDADGMGRAYPTKPQTAMNLAGVDASPCVLCDERLDTVVLRTASMSRMERLVRSTAAAFGGAAVEASYLMTAEVAATAVVRGTPTLALEIGAALLAEGRDPARAVCSRLGVPELIRGRVIEIRRQPTEGFVRGSAVVQDDDGRLVRIEMQNEYLVALEGGSVCASVPDVISVLDAQTGDVIQAERLRSGQRVSVIAFDCDPVWRTDAGLAIGGPAAFGYDFPYVPLEHGPRDAV